MQIIDRTLHLPPEPLQSLALYTQQSKKNFCIFDIETTGLSPKISSLYLIGALWYDGDQGQYCTRQWFADDYISEADILLAFGQFLEPFTLLLHYNGSGFDIPYIQKKCGELDVDSPFHKIQNLDIYREIRRFKSLFPAPDLKLPTVERLTGFMRKDLLSGRDCIDIYSQFMQKKYFRDEGMELEKQKLLLHNLEDLIGTLYSALLLNYKNPRKLLQSGTEIQVQEQNDHIYISIPSPCHFPFPLTWEPDPFAVHWEGQEISIRIPLYHGALCHFFKNYKDYYYLPAEDTAIHKSVGTYVEKEFRQPAKASNCYTKKVDTFLPVPAGLDPVASQPLLFRAGYREKQSYVVWDDKARQDEALLRDILCGLLENPG